MATSFVINLVYYVCIIIVLHKWVFSPEDIVGTRELALLLVFMVWQGLGRDE